MENCNWADGKPRCRWVVPGDDLYRSYHDEEWGIPLHGECALFELFCLEGMQAGLSWRTILHKRTAFREAFDNFDVERVSDFSPAKIDELMKNSAIIRNRRKLEAVVRNARAFRSIQEAHGGFDSFLWAYVNGRPIQNSFKNFSDVPCRTPLSDLISADLQRAGFLFAGTKIVYSFMQSAGLVNDHTADCFLYAPDSEKNAKSSYEPTH